jgi:hypothetical protein
MLTYYFSIDLCIIDLCIIDLCIIDLCIIDLCIIYNQNQFKKY